MKTLFIFVLLFTFFVLYNTNSHSQCMTDPDCDDGFFCNGQEICDPSGPSPDAMGCIDGPDPCAAPGTVCNEVTDICDVVCPSGFDDDGDGHDKIACGGDDCDDTDGNKFPGNVEACDAENHDEDCDPETFGMRDTDGDGFIDATCCNDDGSGSLNCGDDCDDFRRHINPLQSDICNGIDDDCDGVDDDGDYRSTLYPDSDQDGYGVPAATPTGFVNGCAVPMGNLGAGDAVGGLGYSLNSGDCDDSNPAIKPGAMICNGNDDNNNSPFGNSQVLVCGSDGMFVESQCPDPMSACITQPNGTGLCQVKNINK